MLFFANTPKLTRARLLNTGWNADPKHRRHCLTRKPTACPALGMDPLSEILCCRPSVDPIRCTNITTINISPISTKIHHGTLRVKLTCGRAERQGQRRVGRTLGPWEVSGTSSVSGPNLGNCGSTEAIFGRPGRPFMWQSPGASFCVHFGGLLRLEKLLSLCCHFKAVQDSCPLCQRACRRLVTGARLSLPSRPVLCSANPSSRPGSAASLAMLGFRPRPRGGVCCLPSGSPCTLPLAPEVQRTFGRVCGRRALISSLLCSQTARSSCIRRPRPHQRVTSAVRFTCRLLMDSPHSLYAGSLQEKPLLSGQAIPSNGVPPPFPAPHPSQHNTAPPRPQTGSCHIRKANIC